MVVSGVAVSTLRSLPSCFPLRQKQANEKASAISLPKLVDFDWRVDVKTSSDAVARMSVPTCILNLQMEGNLEGRDSQTEWQSVNVELSKETLDTMLDGLSKIREQLASVARR
ncbi:COMM domain-containing protein 9-like isoform X2 [Pomacea canaliculata]|uniref:COMM domain-containing protein 9-like isoform X2 n=1 Tax=Pomacea canaliculata TaxID=400727 RepID=UPI000D72C139|nr:COMM domain-containing protein 9-like isoform X2 [Pomacea canaliculata]